MTIEYRLRNESIWKKGRKVSKSNDVGAAAKADQENWKSKLKRTCLQRCSACAQKMHT